MPLKSNAVGLLDCRLPRAPIAQGIEHRSPEAGAQVRILLGAPSRNLIQFHNNPLASRAVGEIASQLLHSLRPVAVGVF